MKHKKCSECPVFYHAYCVPNFTNEMMHNVFICSKCLLTKFSEEVSKCEKCANYTTNRKPNLVRHQLTCGRIRCQHCEAFFKTNKELKMHKKEIERSERNSKLLEYMQNEENKHLMMVMEKMDLEMEKNDASENEFGKSKVRKNRKNEKAADIPL